MSNKTIKIYDYVSHRSHAVESENVNITKTKSTKGVSSVKVPGRKTICEIHLKKDDKFYRPVLFTSKQTFDMVTKLPRGKWA